MMNEQCLKLSLRECQPGQRIRFFQEIQRREGNWANEVTGIVKEIRLQKTGSWFAHSKDDRLWLCRILLQKEGGELSLLTLDPQTQIEVIADGNGQPAGRH